MRGLKCGHTDEGPGFVDLPLVQPLRRTGIYKGVIFSWLEKEFIRMDQNVKSFYWMWYCGIEFPPFDHDGSINHAF